MTYEIKNITFHVIRVKVSSNSQCSRTFPMNVAIQTAHRGCERNSCKDFLWVGGGAMIGSTPLPRGFECERRGRVRCTQRMNEREGEKRDSHSLRVTSIFHFFMPHE